MFNIYVDEAMGKLWEVRYDDRHELGANRPLGKPVTGHEATLYLCITKRRRKSFHPLVYLVYYVHPATVVFGSKLLLSAAAYVRLLLLSHAVYRSWILKASPLRLRI